MNNYWTLLLRSNLICLLFLKKQQYKQCINISFSSPFDLNFFWHGGYFSLNGDPEKSVNLEYSYRSKHVVCEGRH